MKKLTLPLSCVLFLGLGMAALQAQTPTNPRQQVPSFVNNPWANPLISYQQRQRDLQVQRENQKNIQDLIRLEQLKLRREVGKEAKLTTSTEGQPPPKTSVSYGKPTGTSAGTTAAAESKPKKMRKAEDEPESKTTTKEEPKPKLAKTYSNYSKMIRK